MKIITYLSLLSVFLLLVGCCGDKQEKSMSITVNLRYTGTDGNARKFAEEMISSAPCAGHRATTAPSASRRWFV